MHKVTHVQALEGYKLDVTFADGTEGTVDLSELVGKGVFQLWDDYEKFRQVEIGETGELIWADQVDICPDSLYLRVTGEKPEDIFPGLKRDSVHA